MKKNLFLYSILSSLVLTSLSAPAAPHDPLQRSENVSAYDRLYPYYIEACAVTRRTRLGEEKGGLPGHGAMYLKGACRDTSAEYPRLTECQYSAQELEDPNAGVGVSVNQMFSNVNWVAVPGKTLFLEGDIPRGQRFTLADMDRVSARLLKMDTHRGIVLHDKWMEGLNTFRETRLKGKNVSLEEARKRYVIDSSYGTDFALANSRNTYCVKIPVTRRQMKDAIDYLNDLNQKYFDSYKEALRTNSKPKLVYRWAGLDNNCTHIVHNALAATGYVQELAVDYVKLDTLLGQRPMNDYSDQMPMIYRVPTRLGQGAWRLYQNFQNPASEMLRLMERGYAALTPSGANLLPKAKEALDREGWLPQQPGVMTELYLMNLPNEVFAESGKEETLLARWSIARAKKYLTQDDYTRLKPNLHYWENEYTKYLDYNRNKLSGRNESLKREYFARVEQALVEVRRKLEKLLSMPEAYE